MSLREALFDGPGNVKAHRQPRCHALRSRRTSILKDRAEALALRPCSAVRLARSGVTSSPTRAEFAPPSLRQFGKESLGRREATFYQKRVVALYLPAGALADLDLRRLQNVNDGLTRSTWRRWQPVCIISC
ncbi:unnamed protein product [Symbiodinium sp. CCMP2456]|nr:unnamed protein product [Symbiodinium sp. CCMP2456]